MNITYKTTKEDINWQEVSEVLERSHLSVYPAEVQKTILYTHPQTVLLYEKLGFRRAKTAMELFYAPEDHLDWLEK